MGQSNGGEQAGGGSDLAAQATIPAAIVPGADDGTASADVVRLAARAFERDRYLSALLAPVDVRDDLIALAAFAGEVARIPATVSEPMIGAIRLQWWRDAIEAVDRDPNARSGHPIGDAVAKAMVRHRLPAGVLIGFIDAQDLCLGSDPPIDDLALAQHLGKTEGALFSLAIRVLGGAAAVEQSRPVVTAAAMAYGLTRLLSELPALTAEGRTLIPATMLANSGLTLDQLSARDADAEHRIKPVRDRLAVDARRHLAIVRDLVRRLRGKRWRIALLPLATVSPTLRSVVHPAVQPLSQTADILPLTRVGCLAWTYATGRL